MQDEDETPTAPPAGRPGPVLDCLVLTPAGTPDPTLAVAASRAGAVGTLDLSLAVEGRAAAAALEVLLTRGRGRCGAALLAPRRSAEAGSDPVLDAVATVADRLSWVLLDAASPGLAEHVTALRRPGLTLAVVVRTPAELDTAVAVGADAVVARGHEAAGAVGEETALVLLRRFAGSALPLWLQGGIGLHSAAAALVGGAAGVVLDSQLLLARESPLGARLRAALGASDGGETVCVGADLGRPVRLFGRAAPAAVSALREVETRLLGTADTEEVARVWDAAVAERIDWTGRDGTTPAVGQDVGAAAQLAEAYGTVGGIVGALTRAATSQLRDAADHRGLAEGAPLARRMGVRGPVVQGPMTRVSDRAGFARSVADGGGLPFLALSLLRGPEVTTLLSQTAAELGDRPWGVGILGFVPDELRAEQHAAVRAHRPPRALLAGGTPAQAHELESDGIATFLHAPSPHLLELYVQAGLRRFVFEGLECGGHVGPRSSLVLWDSAVRTLLRLLPAGSGAAEFEVLFAGGISDRRSAAMAAAAAAPLTARGVGFGVLVGTAYLFTPEAVEAGAITPGFQRAALDGRGTTLLESGPGHRTRALPTPYAADFARQRRELIGQGLAAADLRERLEALNIGRLRVAAKGVDRVPGAGGTALAPVGPDTQQEQGLFMIGQVVALHDGVRPLADLHRDVTTGAVEELSRLSAVDRSAPADAPSRRRPAPVAIVGMGTILPGAPDLRRFWANIVGKVDAVTEIPADRWDWRRHFDSDRHAKDRVYGRWGGFVDDVDFDPVAFGMPPSSVSSIEPFQLLGLLTAEAALSDAGYRNRPFPRDRTAVILGAGGGGADLVAGYMTRSMLPELFDDPALIGAAAAALPEWTEDSFPGLLMNVAAGRIANRLDLGGSNFTVDAACGSSLAAVVLGVRELQTGSADAVIAGGVDAIQNPFGYLCFSKTQALSPTGRCRPFDAAADGIAISEGFAMVLLKRLSDAERDGDRVYAVIRGAGSSSDGRDRSLTAPRPAGQVRALRRAYTEAGISPATVGLVEAHGTGTVAGDRAEAASLATVFGEADAATQACAIGSVKSMIGHTKATAGVAGLVKVALALDAKVIPPTLGVTRPNPETDFPRSPFYVSSETRPWVATDHPRRAGVSAFGFGGTNFHVVLEEHTGDYLPDPPTTLDRWPAELFSLAAADPTRLAVAAGALADQLEAGARPDAVDLAAALTGRPPGPARLAVVAGSTAELATRLRRAAARLADGAVRLHEPDGVHLAVDAPPARPALLFPGQGSQYVGMGADLAAVFPAARRMIERGDQVLADVLTGRLSARILPPPTFTPEEAADRSRALTDTAIAQPALGVVGLAYAQVLAGFGVRPAMTAGHSYGELVALAVAGRLTVEDLLRLSAARGRLIVERATGDMGTMAAVDAPAAELRALCEEQPELVLANLNAPRQTVLSGPTPAVEAALAWCGRQGMAARPIPVACAFHSPVVEPARQALAEVLDGTPIALGHAPVWSNTTAATYPEDAEGARRLLARHLSRPVDFLGQIEAMWEAGARVFVECGPKAVLTGLVGRILADRAHVAVPVDRPGRSGLVSLLNCLATQWVEGVEVDLPRLFDGRTVVPLDLARLPRADAVPRPSQFRVNGSRARPATEPPGPRYHPVVVGDRTATNGTPVPSSEPAPRPQVPEAPMPELPVPVGNGSTPPATNGSGPPRTPARLPARDPVAGGPTPGPAAGVPAPDPAGGSASDSSAGVMTRYHDLMQQFLDTQRSVMLAYLGRAGEPVRAPVDTRPTPAAHRAAVGPAASIPAATRPVSPPPAVAVPEGPPPAARSAPTERVPDAQPARPAVPAEQPLREAVAEPPSLEAVTATLLDVVSGRTGYPPDLLGLDADLEADLGIDSIKRVEIAGLVLRELPVPESAARSVDKVTQGRTLRQVAETVHALLAPAPVIPAEPLPFPSEPAGARHTGRLVTRWSAASPTSRRGDRPAEVGGPDPAVLGGSVLVVAGPTPNPVADAVAQALRARGLAVAVDHGPLEAHSDEGPAGRVAAARNGDRALAAVVHLAALTGATRELSESVSGLVRAAHGDLARAVDQGGAAVVLARDGADWEGAGTHGFCRALALEQPAWRVCAVDLDPAADVAGATEAVLRCLDHPPGVVAAVSAEGRITVPQLVPAPLSTRPARAALEPGAVVLVTGGARGITAEVSVTLAERYRPTLLLVGRTPLAEEPPEVAAATTEADLRTVLTAQLRQDRTPVTPAVVERARAAVLAGREVRATLARVAATGAQAEYLTCDVRDAAAFAGLVDDVYRRLGRIDGVVHGAGVIEDRLLPDKTPESVRRVLNTKLVPARVLAERLRPEGLRFLVFFGSASARLGNRGQTDYAAANAALDALAATLDARWPARVVSVGWGPWAGGMVTPDLRREFARRRVPLLDPADGCRAFLDEIDRGVPGESEVLVAALAEGGPTLGLDGLELAGTPPVGAAPSGPLLVDADRTPGPPGTLELRRRFDLVSDPGLDDHRLDGRPVVPFALALELMAEAAALLVPTAAVTTVTGVRLGAGIALTGGAAAIRLNAESREGGEVAVRVVGAEPPAREHYRAVVGFAPAAAGRPAGSPAPSTPRAPLTALAPDRQQPSVAQVYRDLLFHGPRFRRIAELTLGADGASALIGTSTPATLLGGVVEGDWLLDPVVIDCALQVQVVWARVHWDVTLLPTQLDRLEVLGPFAGVTRVRHEMRIRPTSADPLCHADHWLADADSGRPLVRLHGMTGAGSRALNRLAAGVG